MPNYVLTLAAEDDLKNIWLYSNENWGARRADKYYEQIMACCEIIGDKEARLKQISDVPDGVSVHRCQEHYIFFLDEDCPIIIAILHGSMQFVRWLSWRL